MEKMDEKTTIKQIKNQKKRNKIYNVIYTLRPVLIYEHFFGIFRFNVVDSEMVLTNGKMKLFGMFMVSIYTGLFYVFLRIPTSVTAIGDVVDMMDEIPIFVTLIAYIALVIMTSFHLGETTICVISTFVNLDSDLHINMDKDFYKKSRKQTIKYMILFTACHIVFGMTDVLSGAEINLAETFFAELIYVQQDLEMLLFCNMVFMLKSRLHVINEHLAKFINGRDMNRLSIFTVIEKEDFSESKFNFIGRISESNTKIRDLAVMYDTIGETCRLINDIFKFQIFMNLLSTFAYIIIAIWTTLYYFRTPENMASKLTSVIIWCVVAIISVGIMSLVCESLLRTRHNTRLLVNEIIMDYDLPKTMRVQAKVFMELIDAWPLRIYVYDMFSVDIKLMLKFISVATTYLIVIIQISHFV